MVLRYYLIVVILAVITCTAGCAPTTAYGGIDEMQPNEGRNTASTCDIRGYDADL